jgi:hypothetical protein
MNTASVYFCQMKASASASLTIRFKYDAHSSLFKNSPLLAHYILQLGKETALAE